MTALTPAFDSALAQRSALIFGAVAIDLPGYQLNLLDGSALLSFGGRTYVGKDATYGVLAAVDDITEGTGDEAPRLSITILPTDNAAADDLASPAMQGSTVALHVGAVDPATGLVIPDPDLCFLGELDVPTLKVGPNSRTIEYEVASAWERFFADDEGIRLSPGWHKDVWPGETGLDDITGITQTDYWGVEAPTTSAVGTAGQSSRYMDRTYQ